MATSLDLQEQEQLDALKAFWARWGNLITWVLVIALAAYGGWSAWQWWQRDQAVKAAALFDEFDRAAQAGDADKTARTMALLKEKFPRTAAAQQAGLLGARVALDGGKADQARAALEWVRDNGTEPGYVDVARLRLAGLMLEAKQFDAALKELDGIQGASYAALTADRRGDVLLAQGKRAEALAAYQAAWKGMDAGLEYRRLVEAKLNALGASPEAAVSPAAASAPASAASGAKP
jgi:predicted negative regulator of RcsB-dependent stress response